MWCSELRAGFQRPYFFVSGSTVREWKEKYSQHEKHPRANGGDDHAGDFGGDDVFDDLVHQQELIRLWGSPVGTPPAPPALPPLDKRNH